ncbi:protein of unknown function [Methanoculleus bourgensis]|uniref:Uncharacterized protein n=1 Tax=Methanoculleus bourgensis TaxID=83986 RepID=A0A0X3BNI9_9EURY|nr:protein of unknown function [Methanoculleus bourgensis]
MIEGLTTAPARGMRSLQRGGADSLEPPLFRENSWGVALAEPIEIGAPTVVANPWGRGPAPTTKGHGSLPTSWVGDE